MADYPITAVDRRTVLSGSAGIGPYAFAFPVLTQTDLAVYKDDTKLTLTTDYTVSIGAAGTGSVTLVVAATASNNVTIVGARAIERTTDFVTAGDLLASSLNTELDSQTIFAQQTSEDAGRAIKAPVTDPTSIDMTLPTKASRAGKILAFDSTTGDPIAGDEIGNWRGDWAASTAYTARDVIKDASNYNVYRCNTAHTSSGTTPVSSNADSAKWDLVIDAAYAATQASNAAASASAAATSETNAATSASASSTSASNAATSASNASTSASNASTSATSAATSATTAAASATTAAASATTAATYAGTQSVDLFNGTGSQTAFTLSAAPAIENNTSVYISGVYQQKNTYSVSGTTLTFSTAPPIGTGNVEVMHMSTMSTGVDPIIGTTTTGAPGSSASVSVSGHTLSFAIPRGDVGSTGSTGSTGAAATITVGSTTTGSAGTNASVVNSGSSSAANFNFTIPKGDQGVTGTAATIAVGTVTTGAAGSSAAIVNGGSSSAATFNFTIPKGDTGATGTTGSTGTAATIAAGTATGLTVGSAPTVTNSGSSSAATFNFGIPAGATGATGSTGSTGAAATIAAGTATGLTVGSAPTVTNSGSSSAATFNFGIPVGATGATGSTGSTGSAATIAVGTTTTGAAGSSASVANSGSSSAATFDFAIPKGDTGTTGTAATIAAGTATGLATGASPTVTNSGSSSAATFNFGIPAGATGNTGNTGSTGAAATIAAGTATGLTVGSAPTVTNSGSSSAATFNFGIPVGATGATGSTGSTGATGTAATIAVGTTTTGAAGSAATVTNVGSSSAATFNFVVPQGAAGTGSGDVTGPASSTDNAIARFDSTTGKLLQNSTVTVSDVGAVAAASLTLTTDLAIADGGTGASTAGAALTALGAAASGANSDITSLTGLTTDLTVAQGGTGAGTFTANGLLIGNGTGAVTATAVGTATHVLTSNGVGVAPTFQAAAGGGGVTYSTIASGTTLATGTYIDISSYKWVKAWFISDPATAATHGPKLSTSGSSNTGVGTVSGYYYRQGPTSNSPFYASAHAAYSPNTSSLYYGSNSSPNDKKRWTLELWGLDQTSVFIETSDRAPASYLTMWNTWSGRTTSGSATWFLYVDHELDNYLILGAS